MDEIWKDIVGYEGKYQVSNLGRIKSLSRKRWNGFTYANKKEQILKPRLNQHGYLHVCLYDGNRNSKDVEIQRLVAQTFIPNPNNLRCDYKYNNNYGNHNLKLSLTRQKKKYKSIAIKNGRKASKAVVQFDLNGKQLHIFFSQSEAARETNSTQDGISRCCNGKCKSHNGYLWKLVKV